MQRELPFAEDANGGHDSHHPAPGLDENVFSGQAVHREKIISGLSNLPAGHRWHCGAGAPPDPVTCTATHNNTITFFLLLSMLYSIHSYILIISTFPLT